MLRQWEFPRASRYTCNAFCALAIVLAVVGCAGEEAGEKQRRRIVLVPIGPVPADVLEHLQRELPAIVQRDVIVAPAIALPEGALDRSRHRVLGNVLLEELERRGYAGNDRVVGVIDADCFAPGLNFIFGQARKPGRFAVIALPRLRASVRGRAGDPALLRGRALKVATHELGHTFGFGHCLDPHCVMYFSNSVGDTDRTGTRFCRQERLPR